MSDSRKTNGYDMYDARFNDDSKDHDKYFTKHESGEYILRDGYEERYLGSGDNVNSLGAEKTFSNDYDDLWDSYEPNRDKHVYGIYKTPEQNNRPSSPEPAVEQPIAEEIQEDPTYQLSKRAASANASTSAYEQVLLNKQGNATIKGDLTPEQQFKDQYQLNLTNELKVQSPSTLQAKKAEIALADQQKDDYSLELGGRR